MIALTVLFAFATVMLLRVATTWWAVCIDACGKDPPSDGGRPFMFALTAIPALHSAGWLRVYWRTGRAVDSAGLGSPSVLLSFLPVLCTPIGFAIIAGTKPSMTWPPAAAVTFTATVSTAVALDLGARLSLRVSRR